LAGQRVVDQPGEVCNPLYIYGGEGLGKTHLMHAIANALVATGHKRVVCQSAEKFVNNIIAAIRDGATQAVPHQYRNADVLMIDDVQFIAEKEEIQKELLCIFDALYDLKKQIILASNCPPCEIPELDKRIGSRFQSGFAEEITTPSLETRLIILAKKAEAAGVSLDDDVSHLLASRFTTNIRELEGALTRLVAYAALTDKIINLDLAENLL